MHLFEKNIKDLGHFISEPPVAVANYVPFKVLGDLVYVSGQAPIKDGKIIYKGKVGEDVSEEDGVLAAELCCLNIIAALCKSINGDWERFDNFVKLGGFVNCKDDYTNQPMIINGASDLLVNIFGEQGKHTRFAVGSNSLPMNISVEIDAIIKIK
jgi:enamine deaminase RidA (YjgF/YER057c/UK114 family)